jgi:hypothetical protein
MEYPTYSRYDQTELHEVYTQLQSINSVLNCVESQLKNNPANSESSACSFISSNINPNKTYFATNANDSHSSKMRLDKHDWRSLFIMNPLPANQLQYMITQIELYIGKVARAEYVWAIKEQRVVLYIKCKYWYDTQFVKVFRSELIISQERNKHRFTKESIKLEIDFGRHIFDIVLCKRKSNEDDASNNDQTILIINDQNYPHVMT